MVDVAVPESASAEEAAAIVAAVNAHLAGEAGGDEERDSWNDRQWRFRGRVEGIRNRTVRAPRGAPRSPWRAAGRSDRF